MKRLLLLGLAAVWIPATADAYQRCQYFSDGREPRCLYQSDTGKEQYKDGRGQRPSAAASEARRRMLRHRMAVGARMQEGARHTQDMRSGGTPSVGGSTMSPFVPGSDQDRGWQLERKRRGLCGSDQRCLNTR